MRPMRPVPRQDIQFTSRNAGIDRLRSLPQGGTR